MEWYTAKLSFKFTEPASTRPWDYEAETTTHDRVQGKAERRRDHGQERVRARRPDPVAGLGSQARQGLSLDREFPTRRVHKRDS